MENGRWGKKGVSCSWYFLHAFLKKLLSFNAFYDTSFISFSTGIS